MLSPIPTGPGYDPGDSSVAAPPAKPTVVVVHVQEHPLDRDVQAIQQVLATDPCRILGHRAAYLRAGGVACGICGTPL